MTQVEELKRAVSDFEAGLQALNEAKRALDSWHHYDMNRRDGSIRQDAMHEKEGDDLRHAVYSAERTVATLRSAVTSLANDC